jgi:Deoxynucleoside kinases
LTSFYENPSRYALPVEIFFLTERQRQLQEELLQPGLFSSKVIADYCFTKTLLFAKNNLSEVEFELFKRLYTVMANTFPNPDIIIYLHRPADSLLHFIQKRNRSYELDIEKDYLEDLNKRYLSYFKVEKNFPVLILDLGSKDFVDNTKLFKKIYKLLQKSHPNGISYINFAE